MRRWQLAIALALVWLGIGLAAPARAHVGAVVANANFTQPAPPVTTPADQGVLLSAPTIDTVTVGQPYTISWTDGDNDPTGRFYFYYYDHGLPFAADATVVESVATLIADGNGVWAGCTCDDDAGVMCPDAGTRDCRNSITWNTTGVAPNTYWIYAVNNDPPYHVYKVSESPVRVQALGMAAPPPAAIILRPDGYGAFDTSYRVQWYATGAPPLTVDLSYGVATPQAVLGPTTSLAKNVMGFMNADGTEAFDWDISKLENLQVFFLRVQVTDGHGVQTFTDSHFGLAVFHPADDGGVTPTPDLSMRDGGSIIIKPPGGCSCSFAPGAGGVAAVAMPLAIALAAVVMLRARARARAGARARRRR
jgi:hypothetical protein